MACRICVNVMQNIETTAAARRANSFEDHKIMKLLSSAMRIEEH